MEGREKYYYVNSNSVILFAATHSSQIYKICTQNNTNTNKYLGFSGADFIYKMN